MVLDAVETAVAGDLAVSARNDIGAVTDLRDSYHFFFDGCADAGFEPLEADVAFPVLLPAGAVVAEYALFEGVAVLADLIGYPALVEDFTAHDAAVAGLPVGVVAAFGVGLALALSALDSYLSKRLERSSPIITPRA